MRKNSKFLNRSSLKAQHTKIDLLEFLGNHSHQYGYYKHASFLTYFFIYKYLLMSQDDYDDLKPAY
jgi:hypothetical protein